VAPRPAQVEQAPQEAQRTTQRKARKSLAQVRQEKGIIVGEQMKQDGGVARQGLGAFNVSRGPMGEYGSRMWAAVQQKWYAILDERRFAGEHVGKVVVKFKLYPNGSVDEVVAVEDSAGEGVFCEIAITGAARFGEWNNEMRSTYGSKPLDCMCVFWY
jgi:outer membrane biosynthesis protein TonB